jgi:putative ABC transport system permease protein
VLIIYYKQISEGYEDRARFAILQKVGMSRREVRSTIQQQILLVFFLPLGTAAVHTAFAYPIICNLLLLFGMNNRVLFFGCITVVFLVFAAVYTLVYRATAHTYNRLVGA